jgi:hypothetical protein
METKETLSGTIALLREKGYTEDFNLHQQCIECRAGQYRIFHNEFEVDDYYRFEGESDPADAAIVYAISSDKYGLKGVLVNGYGIYTNDITDEMLNKLRIH